MLILSDKEMKEKEDRTATNIYLSLVKNPEEWSWGNTGTQYSIVHTPSKLELWIKDCPHICEPRKVHFNTYGTFMLFIAIKRWKKKVGNQKFRQMRSDTFDLINKHFESNTKDGIGNTESPNS